MRRDGFLLGVAAFAAIGVAIALLYARGGHAPVPVGPHGPLAVGTIPPDVSGDAPVTPPPTTPAPMASASPEPTAAPEIHVAVYDRPIPTAVATPGSPMTVGPDSDVQAPVLVSKVEPKYPEPARKGRMEGAVVIQAIITTDGEVRDARVARPVSPLLDEAALVAVRQWKYRPATLDGKPVRVYLTITVTFSLH